MTDVTLSAGFLNIGGMDKLVTALLGVAVLALAVGIAVRAHGSKFAKTIEMLVIALVAALVAGLANGGNFAHVGADLLHTIFG